MSYKSENAVTKIKNLPKDSLKVSLYTKFEIILTFVTKLAHVNRQTDKQTEQYSNTSADLKVTAEC